MKGIASVLSAEERAGERAPVVAAIDGDLAPVGVALAEAYRTRGEVACARIGLKDSYRDDLIGSFRSLMSYLVAAGGVDPTNGWASATAIMSANPASEPPGLANRIRLDLAHADLLRSPEVAQIVTTLLGRGPAPNGEGGNR
jgi:hypothetical protein